MTYYVQIDPVQSPFDIGRDGAKRMQWSCNYDIFSESTETMTEEIAQILLDASVGTIWDGTNGDIFYSSEAPIPTGNGPYLTIIEGGGRPPSKTQNETSPPAYIRPSVQIVCTALVPSSARAMAYDAYLALLAVTNQEVTAA